MSPERIDMLVKEIEELRASSGAQAQFASEIRGSVRTMQWIGGAFGAFLAVAGCSIIAVMWNSLISLDQLRTQVTFLPKVSETDIKLLEMRVTSLEARILEKVETKKPTQ